MFNWIRGLALAPTSTTTTTSVLTAGSGAVELRSGQVHRLRLRAGEVLLVRRGQVWMTRQGDPLDHLLTPSQGHVAARSEDVVIESFVRDGSLYERQALPRRVHFSRNFLGWLPSRLRTRHR